MLFFPKFQAKDFYTIRFLLSLGVDGGGESNASILQGSESAIPKRVSSILSSICKLVSIHGTCHSDILTFDASLQLKKCKHPKKQQCFFGCLYVFLFSKNGPPTDSHLFFPSKFGAAQLASLCCCWPGIPWLERAAALQLH